MADFLDSLFSMGQGGQAQQQPMSFDPTVGAGASAPWSSSGSLPQMGQTDSRTGATGGTPNPDFMNMLMQLLNGTKSGSRLSGMASNASKAYFGDPMRYGTGGYKEGAPMQPMQPMAAADGNAAGIISAIAYMY